MFQQIKFLRLSTAAICSVSLLLLSCGPNATTVSTQLEPAVEQIPVTVPEIPTASDGNIVIDEALPEDYTLEALGMTFKVLPGGSFQMGQSEIATPIHTVNLAAFQIQTTEVTQGQWEAVMGSGNWPGAAPSRLYGVGDNYPMYDVSWCDIVGASSDETNCSHVPVGESFLDKLNAQGHGTYRLPTEAEWEYAARAGSHTEYACGNRGVFNNGANANACPYSMGWFRENNTHGGANYGAKPVGTRLPNAFGLYDMHGNVWEWVHDWYNGLWYQQSVGGPYPRSNPIGSETGSTRVLRGGYWAYDVSHAYSAKRYFFNPMVRSNSFGFRIVRLP